MKLSELITAIGDDNICLQSIDQCADTLDWSAKKGTRITFHTEIGLHPTKGTDKLGIVVWLDRDAVKKAIGQ